MKRKFTALTPESMAIMGILDEAYDMYNDFILYWEKAVDNWKEERIIQNKKMGASYQNQEEYLSNQWRAFRIDSLEKKFETIQKKRISAFLNKHISIFSNEYTGFHLSVEAAKYFSIITWQRRPHPVDSIRTYMTFRAFSVWLEILVWRQFCIWKKRDFPKLQKDTIENVVFSLLEAKINEETSARRQERICRSDEDTVPVFLSDEILVFKSLKNVSCNLKKHEVVADTCKIYASAEKRNIIVPIHVCQDCHRKFIGAETLKQFSKSYGKLYVITRDDDSDYDNDVFKCFANESKLHTLGYNVVDGEMSDQSRKDFLKRLIQSGQISYFEACRDIEYSIRLFRNSSRHRLAVKKWESDLKFIGESIV